MNFKTIPALGRIIGKAVIAAALACPVMFTSCAKFAYDDSELKESIKDLNDRLTALEQKMNEQIAALTSLVNSKTTVTEVSTDQSGNTVITLSTSTFLHSLNSRQANLNRESNFQSSIFS